MHLKLSPNKVKNIFSSEVKQIYLSRMLLLSKDILEREVVTESETGQKLTFFTFNCQINLQTLIRQVIVGTVGWVLKKYNYFCTLKNRLLDIFRKWSSSIRSLFYTKVLRFIVFHFFLSIRTINLYRFINSSLQNIFLYSFIRN